MGRLLDLIGYAKRDLDDRTHCRDRIAPRPCGGRIGARDADHNSRWTGGGRSIVRMRPFTKAARRKSTSPKTRSQLSSYITAKARLAEKTLTQSLAPSTQFRGQFHVARLPVLAGKHCHSAGVSVVMPRVPDDLKKPDWFLGPKARESGYRSRSEGRGTVISSSPCESLVRCEGCINLDSAILIYLQTTAWPMPVTDGLV